MHSITRLSLTNANIKPSIKFSANPAGVGTFPLINQAPGHLFIVSGPSGSGKGTVINGVAQDDEFKKRFTQVKSFKTRPPRPGEVGSADSKSISVEEFLTRMMENRFFQWTKFDGHFYGSDIGEVLGKLNKGVNILFEMTAQCAMDLKAKYPDKVTTIFNAPPKPELQTLRERLEKRGTNDEASIQERLKEAQEELKFMPKFDFVVVNDKIEQAVADMKSILFRPVEAPSLFGKAKALVSAVCNKLFGLWQSLLGVLMPGKGQQQPA